LLILYIARKPNQTNATSKYARATPATLCLSSRTASELPHALETGRPESEEYVKALMLELGKQTPLEHCLSVMNNETYPPELRLKAAGLALPFCHSKKAHEPSKEVREITEIRRVIVRPDSQPDAPVQRTAGRCG
jgi:hypothetical protein